MANTLFLFEVVGDRRSCTSMFWVNLDGVSPTGQCVVHPTRVLQRISQVEVGLCVVGVDHDGAVVITYEREEVLFRERRHGLDPHRLVSLGSSERRGGSDDGRTAGAARKAAFRLPEYFVSDMFKSCRPEIRSALLLACSSHVFMTASKL